MRPLAVEDTEDKISRLEAEIEQIHHYISTAGPPPPAGVNAAQPWPPALNQSILRGAPPMRDYGTPMAWGQPMPGMKQHPGEMPMPPPDETASLMEQMVAQNFQHFMPQYPELQTHYHQLPSSNPSMLPTMQSQMYGHAQSRHGMGLPAAHGQASDFGMPMRQPQPYLRMPLRPPEVDRAIEQAQRTAAALDAGTPVPSYRMSMHDPMAPHAGNFSSGLGNAASDLLGFAYANSGDPSGMGVAPRRLHRPCAPCRAIKLKCDRNYPCGRCKRLGLVCKTPPTVSLGRPRRHVRMPGIGGSAIADTTLLSKDLPRNAAPTSVAAAPVSVAVPPVAVDAAPVSVAAAPVSVTAAPISVTATATAVESGTPDRAPSLAVPTMVSPLSVGPPSARPLCNSPPLDGALLGVHSLQGAASVLGSPPRQTDAAPAPVQLNALDHFTYAPAGTKLRLATRR